MQKKEKNTKKRIGCGLVEIDRKLVNEMIREQLSIRAIADIIGVDEKTIRNRFSAYLTKRKSKAIRERVANRIKLRQAQWTLAIDKQNAIMQVWLGKNELGQTDKIETTENRPKTKTRRTHN